MRRSQRSPNTLSARPAITRSAPKHSTTRRDSPKMRTPAAMPTTGTRSANGATVAPFALLVPVVGMAAGTLIFGEALRAVELCGALLVMAGLAFNVFGGRWLRRMSGSG